MIPVHVLKIPPGIWVKPSSNVIDVKFVVPVNTPPTFVGPLTNVFGIVIAVNFGQFLNTSNLISSICPNSTLVKLSQSLNAL